LYRNCSSARNSKIHNTRFNIRKPLEIKDFLDQYVIGQDDAKKILSVAVYNHYKRITQKLQNDDVEIEKSNIIMVGETGTGKTLLAKNHCQLLMYLLPLWMQRYLQRPVMWGRCESMLTRLLQVCNYDIAAAEKVLCMWMKLIRLPAKAITPLLPRDVSGEGVQQGLLKMLEGTEVLVPPQGGRKHPEQKMIRLIPAIYCLYAAARFDGIDKVIARRVNTNALGFNVNKAEQELQKKNMLQFINATDLKSFGLIPELLGRLPVVTHLDPLDAETLRSILTVPKNSLIKQYNRLFEIEGIQLKIDESVYNFMVQKAIEFKLGARGLRSIASIF